MEVKEAISAFEKELACRKMDPKKCVEICTTCQCCVDPAKLEEAFKVAIDVLKKADPQKPEEEGDEYGCTIRYYCPTCGTYFGTRGVQSMILFRKPRYCDCGQAIDWKE